MEHDQNKLSFYKLHGYHFITAQVTYYWLLSVIVGSRFLFTSVLQYLLRKLGLGEMPFAFPCLSNSFLKKSFSSRSLKSTSCTVVKTCGYTFIPAFVMEVSGA